MGENARVCGRFAQPRSSDELARIFGARPVGDYPGERFNVAPTDEVAAVVEHHGDRQVDLFRWGLVPVYADSPRGGARMINARAETLEASPVYRTAFRRWRCLIPADAFYEWRRLERDAAGDAPPRRRRRPGSSEPFAVRRRDGAPMGFAGLWATWRNPETAERLYSCTIVTTAANDMLAPIHPRMPVILEPGDWAAWLDDGTSPPDLRPLLAPAPAHLLEFYPVSSAVNDVRRNGPELLEPIGRCDANRDR